VTWFGEGQKIQFLSCPLPSVCPVPETVLQIKHWTTGVVLSCPSFFNKLNAYVFAKMVEELILSMY